MDLNELADIIEALGSAMPEPMRVMIIQTLRGSAP
jgi:hypothetical protein